MPFGSDVPELPVKHCYTGGRLALWEGVVRSLWRLVMLASLNVPSSSDVVGVSNLLFKAKNLAFLGLDSQSLSPELPLVVPLVMSALALGCLGRALHLGGGGSGVEVFLI